MYDFCCQLKHLLVGILFHNLHHPYIPLHFEEMIFPLVSLIFGFGAEKADVVLVEHSYILLCISEEWFCTCVQNVFVLKGMFFHFQMVQVKRKKVEIMYNLVDSLCVSGMLDHQEPCKIILVFPLN